MSELEPPRFRVGIALGRTFSVLFRNIVPFGILALIFNAPVHLLPLFVDLSGYPPFGALTVGLTLGGLLLGYLLSATLVYGTVLDLRGGRASALECVSRGLGLLLPVVGVSILVALIVALGSLLLIVPGIIAMVILWVAVPVAVVERPGIGASLSRSVMLTRGYRWHLFGLIVILMIINLAISQIIGIGFVVFSESGFSVALAQVINLLVQAFVAALFAVASAVAYHDLRIANEGASIEQIAAVFD
jgi:hypothetical protein